MSSSATAIQAITICKRLPVWFLGMVLLSATAQAGKEPDVGYVQTPQTVVLAMLELAEVEAGDLVVDLGSGDGRIPVAAASEFDATGWGIEIDKDLVAQSRQRARDAGVAERVHFTRGDIFETDFSQADVVTLYLLPELNRRLRPQLLAMPAGTRVVSHEFGMGGWPPDRTERVGKRPIHLWMVPARIDGNWSISDGENHIHLSLAQRFQRFEGTARWEEADWPIRDARINGEVFEFSLRLDDQWLVFRGKASGDGIEQLESAPALSGFRPVTQWEMTRVGGSPP